MDNELAAIEGARAEGDLDAARGAARVWLLGRPDVSEALDGLTIPTLVAMIDDFREAGDEEGRVRVSAYLLAQHAPQSITGASAGLGG